MVDHFPPLNPLPNTATIFYQKQLQSFTKHSYNPLPNTGIVLSAYSEISLMIVDNFPPLNPLPNTAIISQVYSEIILMIVDNFPSLNPYQTQLLSLKFTVKAV